MMRVRWFGVLLSVAVMTSCGGPTTIDPRPTVQLPTANEAQPTGVPQSTAIKTLADFENSGFCRNHGCKKDESWSLKTGGTNHSFKTDVFEMIVEVETRGQRVMEFSVTFIGMGRNADEDLEVVTSLLNSSNQSLKHHDALLFIKQNIGTPVCPTCQVGRAAKSTVDGPWRIWAGTSRPDQVLIFRRISG